MKLLRIEYQTKNGNTITGKFIETTRGFIPIILDEVTYLDKSNKIINMEEINLEKIKKEAFL